MNMYKHIVVSELLFEEFNKLKGKTHNDKLKGLLISKPDTVSNESIKLILELLNAKINLLRPPTTYKDNKINSVYYDFNFRKIDELKTELIKRNCRIHDNLFN